ncbi:peptidoglycan DD-metalloendopeptidase family protein [Streptomyces sp. NPDC093109]|uniref:peptidoglycan DD-metalloendopeptidase family protein n=1 Tax=Streptomyces sp. NPDC093109 TaxID=3154977 RepID=UPI00344C6A04
MRITGWVKLAAAGLIMTPVALGVGMVMLVATFDDDEKNGGSIAVPAGSGLKIGDGAVPAKYAQLIMQAASACDAGLTAPILAAQLKQESGFNPRAASPAGAQGIAQFIPGTWETWGVDGNGDGKKDVWDPEDAIPAQGKFMCSLLKQAKKRPEYSGSPMELALAGYNAGWYAVQKYSGIPPYRETQNYVKIIMQTSVELSANPGSSTSGDWYLPVDGPAGTPYHQKGPAWSSGYHTGIDFAVPTGTPVRAIGPGTVVTSGQGGAYGYQVVIQHEDGKYSQYAHLSSLKVDAGQSVDGGTPIGLSGESGNTFGPHLHFEIRTGPDYGSDISPIPYLRAKGLTI